jgi:hypothetical protein
VLFPKQAYPLAHLKTPIALVMQVRATLTEGVGINAATRLYGGAKIASIAGKSGSVA